MRSTRSAGGKGVSPKLTPPKAEKGVSLGNITPIKLSLSPKLTPSKAGAKLSLMESQPLRLRSPNPVIPKDPKAKGWLEDDLTKMKLNHLLSMPSNTCSEAMIQELINHKEPADFKGTVWGRADRWTKKEMGIAFKVPNSGLKMLSSWKESLRALF